MEQFFELRKSSVYNKEIIDPQLLDLAEEASHDMGHQQVLDCVHDGNDSTGDQWFECKRHITRKAGILAENGLGGGGVQPNRVPCALA